MEIRFREAEWQKARRKAKLDGRVACALLDLGKNYWDLEASTLLNNTLAAPLMRKPESFTRMDQFYTRSLSATVRSLTDKEYEKKVPALLALIAEGRYSSSMLCRSFHTDRLSAHIQSFVGLLAGYVRMYYFDNSLLEMTAAPDDFQKLNYRLDIQIALAIREGDKTVIDGVRDAIYGDNSGVRLNGDIIRGVIRSGDEALVGDLLNLLKTAGLQEGLRQQILEAADIGGAKTFARIVGFCAENDLFRFSSAIRALCVWTGFGIENTRPNISKRLGNVAAEVLMSEAARKEHLASDDLSEVWMALWGYGCYDLDDTYSIVNGFVCGNDRRRRLLAWYFIYNSDSADYKMRMACAHLDERDPEVLAWLTNCLAQTSQYSSPYLFHPAQKAAANMLLPTKREDRRELFDRLSELLPVIGEKKKVFAGVPFDFVSVTLSADPVVGCMMSLAGYEMDTKLTSRLPSLYPYMNSDRRQVLIEYFLHPSTNASDREVLTRLLDDRSPFVKEKAVGAMKKLELSADELDGIAASLKSKSSSYRAAAIAALREQPESSLKPLLHRMLSSKEEFKIQAAIDLVSELKDGKAGFAGEFRSELLALKTSGLSTQTEILLKKLLPDEEKVEYSRENGFGLYDPKAVKAYFDSVRAEYPAVPFDEKAIRAIYPSKSEFNALIRRVDAVFEKHADYEYEVENPWDGSKAKVLFGDGDNMFRMPAGSGCRSINDRGARLGMFPFHEEFREAFGDHVKDPVKMTGLYAVSQSFEGDYYPDEFEYEAWFNKLFSKELVPCYSRSWRSDAMDALLGRGASGAVRSAEAMMLMQLLPNELDPHPVFEKAFEIYRAVAEHIGEENLSREYRSSHGWHSMIRFPTQRPDMPVNCRDLGIWRQLISRLELGDEDFAGWFKYEYRLESIAGVDPEEGLTADDIFRAYDMGLVPKEAIYARLLREEIETPHMLSMLTGGRGYGSERGELFEKHPEAKQIIGAVVDRIADVEEKRGELPTELTHHAAALGALYGSEHFVNLLAALGRENFFRGYEFLYSTDKRAVLSCLLKRCRPTESDTPEKLRALIDKTDISEKRLAEAVMYCPQWAGIAERMLGWAGLKSAVWFFHAHINEDFSAEKETEVALFSPISPERFMDGAFDKDWFLASYNALGEKRFMTLYKSAKYITAGSNNHKRSQLYSDAALGKLDINELEREIAEKRNQERLRCYPLIPIAEGDSREALRRYEFIQRFAKESKQFGAQRRESEKKAVRVALENLAVTTGVMDVTRLMWRMETQKTDQLKPLMAPHPIGEFTARLEIDDEGEASVVTEKAGKALKTVPKAIAKDETFLELKQSAKELKEQKRRSKESLERAMTERTEFLRDELVSMLSNPVLAPMIRKLVWLSNGRLGFVDISNGEIKLIDVNGEILPCGEKLMIAHPHDMLCEGVWHDFMRVLYDRKLVQPFKQVFRELYPITADEKAERTLSRRYAGYQVEPKRTLALLKGRGWTVDYEEGLQRVFYRENLVVRLFALADWFSPAEVEAPTLETISFFNRRTGEGVPLEEVPPVLFSEVMRDIDLVVSIAYAGGVDPETSMSAVEIRIALAEELTRLLKLQNVRFIGSHARIEGKLANWSVHMGSGIVHAEGKGMIPIIPVHSQARGRVFLPFADDDPKTAEIMSKIILLSEDTKIRDPEILNLILLCK